MTFYSQGATCESASSLRNGASENLNKIKIESHRLLTKYVKKLNSASASNGNHLNGYHENSESRRIDDERLKALDSLTEKFSQKYYSDLDNLVLDISNLSDDALKISFSKILGQVFHDSVNWGRIVAMCLFVRLMCIKAYENNKEELPQKYIQWTVEFIDNNLSGWILDHNGWDGLVEFSRNPPLDDSGEELLWHSVKRLVKIAVPLIGVYGALKFLANNL